MLAPAPARLYLACRAADRDLDPYALVFGFYLMTDPTVLCARLVPSTHAPGYQYASYARASAAPDARLRALVFLGTVQSGFTHCIDGVLAAQLVPRLDPGAFAEEVSKRWAHDAIVRMMDIGFISPPVLKPDELLRMAIAFARKHAALPRSMRATTPVPTFATDASPLVGPSLAGPLDEPPYLDAQRGGPPPPHVQPPSVEVQSLPVPLRRDKPFPARAVVDRNCSVVDGTLYPTADCVRCMMVRQASAAPTLVSRQRTPVSSPQISIAPSAAPQKRIPSVSRTPSLPTPRESMPGDPPRENEVDVWREAKKRRERVPSTAAALFSTKTCTSWLATPAPALQDPPQNDRAHDARQSVQPPPHVRYTEDSRARLRKREHVQFAVPADVDGKRARDVRFF